MKYLHWILLIVFLSGCSGKDSSLTPLPIQNTSSFSVTENKSIPFDIIYSSSLPPTNITATAPNNHNQMIFRSQVWQLKRPNSDNILLTSRSKTFNFLLENSGVYEITLQLIDTSNIEHTSSKFIVIGEVFNEIRAKFLPFYTQTIDTDINNPTISTISNNTLNTAQDLTLPSIVSGYVNVSNKGSAGASFSSGDTKDFFKFTVTEAQQVSLHFPENATDLDLFLYQNNTLIDTAQNSGQTEQLLIESSGNYTLEVRALSGASNYQLTIENSRYSNLSSTNARYNHLSDDFVPGEAITQSQPNFVTQSVNNGSSNQLSEISLEKFTLDIPSQQLLSQSNQHSSPSNTILEKVATLEHIKKLNTQSNLIAEPNFIRSLPSQTEPNMVHSIEENLSISNSNWSSPNDFYYPIQWSLDNINMTNAWSRTKGSQSVIVAVLDTGTLSLHPDLSGQLSSSGYDFVSNVSRALDGDGIDSNPEDPGDQRYRNSHNQPYSSFHGTSVASIIGAKTHNSIGISAISPEVSIMSIRVLGNLGTGTSYDLMQGLKYVAKITNDSGVVPAQKAHIANMSLGGTSSSQIEQNIITSVKNAGVILVAAIGNDGLQRSVYPASYDNVIAVSATTYNNTLAPYSNYDASVDISAPGGNTATDLNSDLNPDGIITAWASDLASPITYNYSIVQGTSSAAPHVSGVFALMKAIYSDLSYSDITDLLSNELITDDLGATGKDSKFGYGKINAKKALDQANALYLNTLAQLALDVNPLTIPWYKSSTDITVSLDDGAPNTLTLTSISSSNTWLTIKSKSINNSTKLGTYTISVNRNSLNSTPHSLTSILFTDSNGKELSLPIRVDTNITNSNREVLKMPLYLSLVDSSSLKSILSQKITPKEGIYTFNIKNLSEESEYFIYISSDIDNDGIICDSGELCGSFPSIDSPETIKLEQLVQIENLAIVYNNGAFTPATQIQISPN